MKNHFITLCLLGLFAAGCASAPPIPSAPSAPSVGCISGNCKNGQGTEALTNGREYVGEFKDGKRNGQGTFTFATGRKYAGQWENGFPFGQKTKLTAVTFTLASLLGKNIQSNEIQTWLSKVGVNPEIYKSTDCYYYNFKSKGISLCFNKSDKLTNIFLYSEGADKYRHF